MTREITCINCPVGCRMKVEIENGQVTNVTGNTCKRGDAYARQECVAPMRMVTAVVPLSNRKMPLSVKTRTPIPKEKIKECMTALSGASVCAPVRIGDVVCGNICGTGVDIIATKNIE